MDLTKLKPEQLATVAKSAKSMIPDDKVKGVKREKMKAEIKKLDKSLADVKKMVTENPEM